MIGDMNKVNMLELETKKNSQIKQHVLLFCYKHPKMKFTAECIPLNNKENKTALKDELQALVAGGVVSQQISDTGMVFYSFNSTQQALNLVQGQFTQNFASGQQQLEKR